MQCSLVQNEVEDRPAVRRQQSLPLQPDICSSVDRGRVLRWLASFKNCPSVAFDLKLAVHDVCVVIPDRGGLRLQANVSRIGQIESLIPRSLLTLPGQGHEFLAQSWIGYPVDEKQIPDVAWAGAHPPCLQAAELGLGEHGTLRHN